MDKMLLMKPEDSLAEEKIIVTERLIKAGTEFPPHWHNYFEFEIIISGRGEHIYNKNKYIAETGSAYLMSYHDFHFFKALTDTRLVNIAFNENILDEELARFISVGANKFNCSFDKTELKNIISLIDKIIYERKNRLPFGDRITSNALCEIMIELIRKSGIGEKNPLPKPIQRATAYIHMNFRSDISLGLLAGHLFVSVNYLGALFKKNMGMSFNEYINMLRLKYSCGLLAASALSVREIAFASGYRSIEYFLYVFKKNLNMTPTEYRRCKSILNAYENPASHDSRPISDVSQNKQ